MHLTDLCNDLIKIPAHAGTIKVTGLAADSVRVKAGDIFFAIAGTQYDGRDFIKNAIEAIFKVKVNKVNTSIIRGKGKTFKGQYGFRKDTKRAIVTLDEGNTIDSSLEIK